MKKSTISVCALLLAVAIFFAGCIEQNSVTIKAKIAGLPAGSEVTLRGLLGEISDTATVGADGSFAFSVADITEPSYLRLSSANWDESIRLIVNPGEKAQVEGTATPNGEFYTIEVQIEGAPLTAQFQEKMQERYDQSAKMYEIRAKYSELTARYLEARKAGDNEALEAIKASDEYQQMCKEDSTGLAALGDIMHRAVEQNKETFWAPLLMICQTGYLTEEMLPYYEMMSDAAKQSKYGRYVKSKIAPDGLAGSPCPAFSGTTAQGNSVSLAALMQGKRYLLIDFWASWCNPCRKEIPNVKAQYELYKERGLEVVSISTDDSEEAWRKALDEEQLPWTNLRTADVTLPTGKSCAEAFNIRFIPLIYLVDATTGKVIEENIRGEKLAKRLEELFK